MNELRLKLALAYKIPRVTKFIDDDIKIIKKLNQVLVRLERKNDDRYILESINLLRQLTNVFDFNLLYPVLCELIDIRFHTTLLFLCKKLETPEQFVKKLQELTDDEEE